MALIYNTVLRPSKLEMLAAWLPGRAWFTGDATQLEPLGAYRFDDPDGEVGIEGHILSAGGDEIYHVPLTYRGAPFDGSDAHLLGTVEHGVLGTRWFFDAEGDPVYRSVLAHTIVTGGREAAEYETDDPAIAPTPKPIHTHVWGVGSAGSTLGRSHPEDGELEIVRTLTTTPARSSDWALRGTWPGASGPAAFAYLHAA